MYFEKFPKRIVDFGNDRLYLMRDITKNVRIQNLVRQYQNTGIYYDVDDEDTFEKISEKLYGTPYYHWLLMLLNEAFNAKTFLPMNETEFEQWFDETYDNDYCLATYNTTNRGVVIDILRKDLGASTSFEGEFLFRDAANALQTVEVYSALKHDEVLKTFVVHWYRKSNNEQIPFTWKPVFGDDGDYSPLTLHAYEKIRNERNRRIRVVDKATMEMLANQFSVLMRTAK